MINSRLVLSFISHSLLKFRLSEKHTKFEKKNQSTDWYQILEDYVCISESPNFNFSEGKQSHDGFKSL